MMTQEDTKKVIGSAMVIGGGISGIQASLDLADSGVKVYLVESSPSIGGNMARLDKTFPTNECSMCVISPKLVDCGRHINIELLTYSKLEEIKGSAGNFNVKIKRRARHADINKCTGCGECVRNCPVRNRVFIPDPAHSRMGGVNLEKELKDEVDKIIDSYKDEKGVLLSVLGDINSRMNYLPRDVLRYVSSRLEIPLTDILKVATFYNAFSLVPRGRHLINVCLGTTCFVKGSGILFEKLERSLSISDGETTKDKRFTLQKVRCIGCCALAPAVRIDNDIYGRVKQDDLLKILELYK